MIEKKYKIGYKNISLTLEEVRVYLAKKNYGKISRSAIEIIQGRKILDVGCNLGVITYEIANKNYDSEVIGIDSAHYLIEAAKDLYKSCSNLRYEAMDVYNLSFKNDEFDCVSLLEVIEHLNDPLKAIREIRRVLKPEGVIVLSTNNVYYSRFFIRQVVYDLLKRKPKLMIHDSSESWNRHIFAWDVSTLATLLKICGFDYIDHFYAGSSGFYINGSVMNVAVDGFFAKIFPFFRATVVIKARKAK